MKYRKKPVVIEAEQFTGPDSVTMSAEDSPLRAICVSRDTNTYLGARGILAHDFDDDPGIEPHVHTLEGFHTASAGDWTIRGVQGECYPCKPDIFAVTYEAVGDFCDYEIGSEVGTILCDKEPFHEGPHRVSNRLASASSTTEGGEK